MKTLRVGFAILGVALFVVFATSTPQAFHSGGVAECAGCHSMHAPKAGGSFLLVGSDPSSACMTCHRVADTAPNSYHVVTAKSSFGPGETPVERTTPTRAVARMGPPMATTSWPQTSGS
jgi:hypothetical protein